MNSKKPNIIIIYADDLGFGDLSCYGGAIPTPHIDSLSAAGSTLYNGYTTAATCTPARYSLLTGSYPWRNPDAAILAGDAPNLIPSDMPTLPKMLKKQGYSTAIVGKWHLGLGSKEHPVEWNSSLQGTPNDVGFDSSYIMAATNDRVPCVYIRDRQVDNLDPKDPIEVDYYSFMKNLGNPYPQKSTGRDNPELLKQHYSHGHDGTIVNGVSRIGFMRGGESALWTDETMAETFLQEAQRVIRQRGDAPLFLYYALHQPHVPRIPSPAFAGTTGLGPRGDVIAELDWCVGELVKTLKEEGIWEDTLLIFSSDNGPVLDDGYDDNAAALSKEKNHLPAGPLRGGKYSLFDGGTRVPFIVTWPNTIQPGYSSSMVCHVDFYATFAKLTGYTLQDNEAPDSKALVEALITTNTECSLASDALGRSELVTEGTRGKTLIRKGDWVYIEPHEGPPLSVQTNTELGNSANEQLYHMVEDVGQQDNRIDFYKEEARKLRSRLEEIRGSSRTR